jgi:PAS domain S-box-containing protein
MEDYKWVLGRGKAVDRDATGKAVRMIGTNQDITERKAFENALQENEKRLEMSSSFGGIGLWELDLINHKAWRSLKHDQIFGYESLLPDWTYNMFLEHVVEEDRPMVDQKFGKALDDAGTWDFECRIKRKDGVIRWISARGNPEIDAKKRPQKMLGAVQDITERLEMENALKDSEEKYRLLFENAQDAIFIADPDTGTLLDVNKSAENLTGYKKHELIGKHQTCLHPIEQSAFYNQEFLKAARDKDSKFKEMVVRTKNGHDIPVEISSGGTVRAKNSSFHVGFFRDISKRKKIYDSLVASELLFKGLYDNMTSGSAIYEVMNDGSKGSDYIVKNFNKKSLELEGKTLEQVVGKSLYDLRPNIDDYGLIPVMKKVWETGEPAYYPTKVYVDDIFANYYENYIFKIPTGEVVTIYNDVTDIKNSEKALKDSEERFSLAMEFANDGLFDWNLETNEIYYSPMWKHLVGYEDDELPNDFSVWETLTHPEDVKRSWKIQNELINRQRDKFEIEFKMKHKDGHWVDILARANAIFDENHKAVRIIGTHVDITERKKLETQLQQAQKLEAIGNLAGGIAHDFNNILSSIIGFTELSLDETSKGSPLEDNLQEVYSAGKRAKDLVKQILSFARQSDEKKSPIQPGMVAKEVLKLLRSTIPTTIEIDQDIASDAWILGSATQVHQVFMNLCTNAAHAMEESGGILKVSLKDTFLEKEDLLIGMRPVDYIEINVSDTGVGIAPELIKSIFDPYFTTKGVGEGSGMGLATVAHGSCRNLCGGKITVESSTGNRNDVYDLPAYYQKDNQPKSAYVPEELPTGTERILFVDDEAPIAKMGSQILERLGYSVTTRTSSIEALELFQSNRMISIWL